jgi:DNA-binding transcriptional regulator PaaX
MDFKSKYPLTTREAVCTPLILFDGFSKNNDIPCPTLKGIRHFTNYCGVSYSALRTSLSRLHAEGYIRIFKDDRNITRYQMTESSMDIGKAMTDRLMRPEGFLLAIFSFTKDDVTERAIVRDTLRYYGFKKLAQNTYINGRIETGSLTKTMLELGLEKNLYLFHCPNVDDAGLIEKILAVFEIEKRNGLLHAFQKDLTTFLADGNAGRQETIHRLYYCGPVHWKVCFLDEPPFPIRYLPDDYPLDAIIRFYTDRMNTHSKDLIDNYLEVNE